MVMIKGALFDIDDTLYSHKIKAVPSLTLKALDKLREKGIKIGVCTSRRISEMDSMPEELLDRIDCQIMDTGAVTLVKDRYFKAYSLEYSDVIRYVEFFKKHNISYHYSDINGDIYFFGDKRIITEHGSLGLAKGKVMFKEYEDEEITDLFFHETTDELVEGIKNINPNQYISMWGNSGAIGPNLVDKGFGLLKFCQVFSLTTDEVIAFGDGPNDDTMLQMAGIGVGIKGGKENTLAVANHVCKKTIEDGGIYETLLDLNVIEREKYDPKIFFFDNDATLYCHVNDTVYDSTYDALKQLKDKGCKLCMNTSRSYEEMYNVPKKLIDMMDDLNLLGGAYCIHSDGIEVHYIAEETAHKLISLFEKYDLTYRYCTDDGRGYLNRIDEYANLFKTLYDMIPEQKAYEGEKVTHLLFYADHELAVKISEEVPDASFSFLKRGAEISPLNVDKGTALVSTTKRYGLSLEDTCAFGDSGNDIHMLQLAKLGICMGNGYSDCKQVADYITDSTDNDGIYNAMKHFGFIE